MIQRVLDEGRANYCDKLLTKLIQDEKKFDNSIDENYEVNNYFKNIIKNKANILLCYEEDDHIVGYIYMKPIMNDNLKGYLIDGLYVEKEYQNKGIGTKLLEKGLNEIDGICEFIDINVLYANKIALNMYKSFGFKEFKIVMRKI